MWFKMYLGFVTVALAAYLHLSSKYFVKYNVVTTTKTSCKNPMVAILELKIASLTVVRLKHVAA